MIKKRYKSAILFAIGGGFYLIFEVIWRKMMGNSPTHWAMFFVGGLSFVLVGGINEWLPWEMSLLKQSLVGTGIILLTELVSGIILNLWLGLGIWDYSDKFLNVCGQICPQFAVVWFLLSGLAIVVDDYLRYWLFGEEKPQYQIVGTRKGRSTTKKIEFSKILVAWALVLTTLCVILSYALSFADHDPASDVTVAVASACIAIAVAYEAKSFGEKNSRNKYGIDERGNKIASDEEDDDEPVG